MVDDAVLASFNISLPISRFAALLWMTKYNAGRMGTGKTYYNDPKKNILKHYVGSMK